MDAVNAEKLFSEFFNTTDAEAEIAASAAPKRLRKSKKPSQVEPCESDSDDEGRLNWCKFCVLFKFQSCFRFSTSRWKSR